MILDTIHCGDALSYLTSLPDASVNCIVTSPPYFNLRNYGVDGQLGSEATMREYIGNLVAIFTEARRVLRDDGTVWVNLGDSRSTKQGSKSQVNYRSSTISVTQGMWAAHEARARKQTDELPQKSLMMIPARFAIAMIDEGWILRDEIVWAKPNPMPESVQDRTTRAHEMIYMFSKQGRYCYDPEPLKTPVKPQSLARVSQKTFDSQTGGDKDYARSGVNPSMSMRHALENLAKKTKQNDVGKRQYTGFNERYEGANVPMANARSVWTFPAVGSKEKHYATFPRELPRRCIAAGCPVDGVVLDPFMGSGTTALVAREMHRHFLGCDLNEIYVQIAERRLSGSWQPMLKMFA